MEVPFQLVILSVPTILYAVLRKLRGEAWGTVLRKVGWTGGKPVDYLWAIGVFAVVAALASVVLRFVPSEILQGSSQYAGLTRNASTLLLAFLREAFYVALGEEVFFRGLLGGWLVRKLGFGIGNLLQAAIFLLPHLLLLQLGTAVWPLFIIQFVAGWLQGWLRHRSDSVLPGWLVHTLSNTSSAFSAMK
jgi:membrane protease YdiL (CAAX protease family)